MPLRSNSRLLRRAMLSLLNSNSANESHPTHWAPFVVVGEGGVDVEVGNHSRVRDTPKSFAAGAKSAGASAVPIPAYKMQLPRQIKSQHKAVDDDWMK